MLQRADLVFIGVIEAHHLDSYPFFRPPKSSVIGADEEWWRPLRRRVRVETVLRGTYSKKVIDVYEIFWLGGATGNWNFTRDGDRYLFMVRRENGRWQIVRDWLRSIYEVRSGYHARLPLDETRPFWERYALMNYWVEKGTEGSYEMFEHHQDPADTLGEWRTTKLLRGLLRHPQPIVRIKACVELDESRDDCFGMFSKEEWAHVYDRGRIRREFCRTFLAKFPGDTDNGCSFDKPLPATIVTENGDVPLIGDWPK